MLNKQRAKAYLGRHLSKWIIIGSVGIILFVSGWLAGEVSGFGRDLNQSRNANQGSTDLGTGEQQLGKADKNKGHKDQSGTGVESIVGQIARATYKEDIEFLDRYASPQLKNRYGSKSALRDQVGAALESAQEFSPGPVEVIDAAPLNLFDEIIFYRVDLKDAAGDTHRIGIVFQEPDESSPVELSYCYLFVENQRLGKPDETSGLWRDVVGNEDTCLEPTPEEKPETEVHHRNYPSATSSWQRRSTSMNGSSSRVPNSS